MAEIILHGFDGSTYVRTVKIILDRKGVVYEENPVDVLKGETRAPEHLARHPFGKVPVLDIDGHRIRETDAICTYVEDTRDGPSAVPESAWDKARMTEVISLVHNYGYDALVAAAFYHLEPDFVGNPSEAAHTKTVERAEIFLRLVGELRAGDDWLAGPTVSLADFYLGPLVFYAMQTPHGEALLEAGGLRDWWERLGADAAFAATEPAFG